MNLKAFLKEPLNGANDIKYNNKIDNDLKVAHQLSDSLSTISGQTGILFFEERGKPG